MTPKLSPSVSTSHVIGLSHVPETDSQYESPPLGSELAKLQQPHVPPLAIIISCFFKVVTHVFIFRPFCFTLHIGTEPVSGHTSKFCVQDGADPSAVPSPSTSPPSGLLPPPGIFYKRERWYKSVMDQES